MFDKPTSFKNACQLNLFVNSNPLSVCIVFILNGKYFTNLLANLLEAYVSCAFVNHVYLNLEYSSIAVY